MAKYFSEITFRNLHWSYVIISKRPLLLENEKQNGSLHIYGLKQNDSTQNLLWASNDLIH